MRCIDIQGAERARSLGWTFAAVAALAVAAGCSAPRPGAAPTPAATTRAPAPAPAAATPTPSRPAFRSWEEYRQNAARRLVAAHPNGTYTGKVPEPLLAIPVLEVELNADGTVRNITVLRHPSQAKDTTQIAMDAVRRAAPYGDVSNLPKPWKFAETFLFDDNRRFKPMTLDR